MNNITIKILAKYSEHCQDTCIVNYEGTWSKDKVIESLTNMLEEHETIVEVIEKNK